MLTIKYGNNEPVMLDVVDLSNCVKRAALTGQSIEVVDYKPDDSYAWHNAVRLFQTIAITGEYTTDDVTTIGNHVAELTERVTGIDSLDIDGHSYTWWEGLAGAIRDDIAWCRWVHTEQSDCVEAIKTQVMAWAEALIMDYIDYLEFQRSKEESVR